MGKFVIKTGKTGVRFNLLAGNGQVIGTSEIYKADASCLNGIESVRKCSAGGIEDLTEETVVKVKHPKFEVYQDKAGEYRFRLKARNGEIILASRCHPSNGLRPRDGRGHSLIPARDFLCRIR